MKAERKGFTLVEMLVAMAVLAIVLGEIGVVLSNTTKIYSKGSYEIFLQSEAQQAVQSIEEVMVDASKEIKKVGDTISVTSYIDKAAGTTTNYTFSLVQDRADRPYKTLYVSKDGGELIPVAEYVKTMDLNTSTYASNSMVTLKLEMEGEGGYQYNVTKDIYNRNEIGTGTIDPDDLTPGTGEKEIDVLRFHTYNLINDLPYGKTWVSATFDDPTSATVYYELSGFTLKANTYLNQYDNDTPTYDITCKASDDSTYKISISSKKPGMSNDKYLFNAYVNTEARCTTYIPMKGLSAADASTCTFEWFMGNIPVCSKTVNCSGGDNKMAITQKKWPSESNKLYESQFSGSSLSYESDFKSNSAVLVMGRMTNPGDENCSQYAQMVYEYEMTQWVKCTVVWPNGKSLTFNAFLYPVGTDGTIFDEDQKAIFWQLFNSGGGDNDAWDKKREMVIDDSAPTYTVDSGSISISEGGSNFSFNAHGTARVTFSKKVHITCYTGSAHKVSGFTYEFTPPDWGPDYNGVISW